MTKGRDDATASRTPDEMAALRAAIDRLEARLDRLEARGQAPGALSVMQDRARAAWLALRGRAPHAPDDPGAAAPPGQRAGGWKPLHTMLMIAAGLLALVLAVELVEELFHGLRRFLRWIT
jgi:hypothetical protein